MNLLKFALMSALALTAAGCSRLSPEAKKIVGNYYIGAVSENVDLLELGKDGRCILRNVKPDVLVISVKGRWNVEGDSLIATLDPATLEAEGDTTIIGRIPERFARRVVEYTPSSLTLADGNGVNYVFQRRLSPHK